MPLTPPFQGRLRWLSGTPQRAMERLEIAAGFLSWEKAPTDQKHFVVILGGATQFHLGGQPAFALERPSLQSGSHLGMGLFFQFVQHHHTGVFKQINGTPFLRALVPQLAKFGLGVETMNELLGMKRACFIQEVVQVRLHLVQVLFFPFPDFGGRIRGICPFLYTFFLILFQGTHHQLIHGLGWFFRSRQCLQGHHEFTGEGLGYLGV